MPNRRKLPNGLWICLVRPLTCPGHTMPWDACVDSAPKPDEKEVAAA